MSKRKLLSNNISKILLELDSMAEFFGVKNSEYYIKIIQLLTEWKAQSIVTEGMTEKNKEFEYLDDEEVMLKVKNFVEAKYEKGD